jgi:hypothetical protein
VHRPPPSVPLWGPFGPSSRHGLSSDGQIRPDQRARPAVDDLVRRVQGADLGRPTGPLDEPCDGLGLGPRRTVGQATPAQFGGGDVEEGPLARGAVVGVDAGNVREDEQEVGLQVLGERRSGEVLVDHDSTSVTALVTWSGGDEDASPAAQMTSMPLLSSSWTVSVSRIRSGAGEGTAHGPVRPGRGGAARRLRPGTGPAAPEVRRAPRRSPGYSYEVFLAVCSRGRPTAPGREPALRRVAGIALAGGEQHPQPRIQAGGDGALGEAECPGDGGAGAVTDEVEGQLDAVERGGGAVGTAVSGRGQVCGSRPWGCSVRSRDSEAGALPLAEGRGRVDGVCEYLGQGRLDNARVVRHEGGQGVDGHQVTVAPGDDRASACEEPFDLGVVGFRVGGSCPGRCGHHRGLREPDSKPGCTGRRLWGGPAGGTGSLPGSPAPVIRARP